MHGRLPDRQSPGCFGPSSSITMSSVRGSRVIDVFEGGFFGLDNLGLFDRSQPLPSGMRLAVNYLIIEALQRLPPLLRRRAESRVPNQIRPDAYAVAGCDGVVGSPHARVPATSRWDAPGIRRGGGTSAGPPLA